MAATTAAEEVWQVLRSLPPQPASLVKLRENGGGGGDDGGGDDEQGGDAALKDTLAALERTEVHGLVRAARRLKSMLDMTSGSNFISLFTENQLPGASSCGLPSGAGSISLGRK